MPLLGGGSATRGADGEGERSLVEAGVALRSPCPGNAAAAIAEKAPVRATDAATVTRVTKEAVLSPRARA